MFIYNKEQMDHLQKVIKKVRDILRNEGITGMDSINHCIVYESI